MAQLSQQQFGPWTETGPLHARLAQDEHHYRDLGSLESAVKIFPGGPIFDRVQQAGRVPGPENHPDQGELFQRSQIPMPAAHQQTPAQFANDPRSWWHGRYASRLTKGGSSEGFHAGSLAAARSRLTQNYGRRSGDKPARLFPMRLTGQMDNTPADPGADMKKHGYLGGYQHPYATKQPAFKGHGVFYENNVEDAGHISVGVPKREGAFSTHKEMVNHALSQGQFVHPNIQWAAKKAPEHTGEDVMAHKRWSPQTGGTSQPTIARGMDPPDENRGYDRRRIALEGGGSVNIWRRRGGNANEGSVWER